MDPIEQWLFAHPGFALPLALAFVVLFVPKSEATLARLPTWLAAFLRVTAALSPDLREAWGVYKSTRAKGSTSTRGVARADVLAVVLSIGVLALGIASSCSSHQGGAAGPASVERATARGAVLTMGAALKAADEACAVGGEERHDEPLLARCAQAYRRGRLALVTAAAVVDTWETADRRGAACGLRDALDAVHALALDASGAGVELPPVVADAAHVVALAGVCP